MHELGVVFHCIKEVNKVAAENGVSRVRSVTVEIGEVSSVVPYLFEDCWNWAVKKETVLKNAEIIITLRRLPARLSDGEIRKNLPLLRQRKHLFAERERTEHQANRSPRRRLTQTGQPFEP